MKVEFKQTKLLYLSTQDYSLISQIDSARQLAVLACPNYNEHNVHCKRVMKLMQDQQDLMKKMSDVFNDITVAEQDILRSTNNGVDQVNPDKDYQSPSLKNSKTSSVDTSNMPREINLASSTA